MVEVLTLIMVSCISAGLLIKQFVHTGGSKQQALPAPVQQEKQHSLVKTWLGNAGDSTGAIAGWRWKCSCGVIGSCSNATKTTLGTETNAVALFGIHRKLYKEANGNEWKDKHDALLARFEDYKKKCYCKDSNNDLILLSLDK